MFFKYNTALGPPFRVLVDTNFINFSIKNKVSAFPRLYEFLCVMETQAPCVSIGETRMSFRCSCLLVCPLARACRTAAAGGVQEHDGLPAGQVHAVHQRLRHGGAREAGV